ncbi:MAG: arginine N-succinyltransferase [Chitinivorax sp.]
MLVRSISRHDLPAMVALVQRAGVGLTSLPSNIERLTRRIDNSVASIAGELEAADAEYLFVLEDDPSGEVVGLCAIAAAVGLRAPWYHYRLGLSVHASQELGIYRQLQTLFLTNDLTGCSELCSLFLRDDYRHSNNGSLLSKSRLLFLAEFRERFAGRVIAEMRGVSDTQGRSPFWDGLGQYFFRMAFSQADYLSGVGDKSFIAELMPQHPVYSALLPEEARAVIGEVHPHTRPALAMLKSEGFQDSGYVDIFDAGPTVITPLVQIRAVRDSDVYPVLAGSVADGELWLLCNRKLANFRVCLSPVLHCEDELQVPAETLQRLQLAVGDTVRAVPLVAQRKDKT